MFYWVMGNMAWAAGEIYGKAFYDYPIPLILDGSGGMAPAHTTRRAGLQA